MYSNLKKTSPPKRCSSSLLATSSTANKASPESLLSRLKYYKSLLCRFYRIAKRAAYLTLLATPLLLTYPLTKLSPTLSSRWRSLSVFAVERGGAAVIKLFQWASSRPDMFGLAFCDLFKKLQDSTEPHAFAHTEAIMEDTYGAGWRDCIRISAESPVLGSGCIGQVYKAVDARTGETVALKILHPNIEHGIDADLDILRAAARLLDWSDERVRWLNFPGMVEEFAGLLKDQLDLRNEARNLEEFRKNFEGSKDVVFPRLFMSGRQAMVMEWMDGHRLSDFVRVHSSDPALLSRTCKKGITAVCQMIFEHNFVHGDVHPGNILFSKDPDPKLVLLDVGIAKRFTRADHQLLLDTLGGFITGDGMAAGRAMIRDSMNREDIAPVEEEGFCLVLHSMCEQAKADHSFFDSIGNYVTRICDAAARHRVMMNQGFVSIALTVRVMEGVALALDPEAEIWRIANKIIMKVRAEELLGTGRDRFSEVERRK
mmetsp:Transcript_14551/g.28976  ORF Transcript_14551/g.28976 Transcript_14551/m.28976 type:complete len:485 (+) Transcript_14551:465-1919(+)